MPGDFHIYLLIITPSSLPASLVSRIFFLEAQLVIATKLGRMEGWLQVPPERNLMGRAAWKVGGEDILDSTIFG